MNAIIIRWGYLGCVVAGAVFGNVSNASALTDRIWVGGTGPTGIWDNNAFNWSPFFFGTPGPDDRAVFDDGQVVRLGVSPSIGALFLLNSADLFTGNQTLNAAMGVETRSAASITFGGNDVAGLPFRGLSADFINVLASAQVLQGGTQVRLTGSSEAFADLLIFEGGTYRGNGDVFFDNTGAAKKTLLNGGSLVVDGFVSGPSLSADVSPGPARALQFASSNPNDTIDLDAFAVEANASVLIEANQTLRLLMGLSDPFSGQLTLRQNSTLDARNNWSMDAGTLNVLSGASVLPTIAAAGATIEGSFFAQSGGTLDIPQTDGELTFNAPANFFGGSIRNQGLLRFTEDAFVQATSELLMLSNQSSIDVVGATVTIQDTDFDYDGLGAATNVVQIQNGTLNLDLGAAADNVWNSTTRFRNGTINADVDGGVRLGTGGSWVTDSGDGTINGQSLMLEGGLIRADADRALTFNSPFTVVSGTLTSNGTVTLADSAQLNGGTINGTGRLVLESPTTVNPSAAINVATLQATNQAEVRFLGNLNVNGGQTFEIDNAAAVSLDDDLRIASATNGTVILDGPGTTLQTNTTATSGDSNLIGFNNGTGVMTIRNRATVNIGLAAELNVGTSSFSNSNGTLNVESGGTLHANDLGIATRSGGTGTLNVVGTDSSVIQTGASSLTIGNADPAASGTGTLNVGNSGTFNTGTGPTTLQRTGTLNLRTGGTFNANGDVTVDTAGTLNLTGGLLNLGDHTLQTAEPLTLNSGSLIVQGGTVIAGPATLPFQLPDPGLILEPDALLAGNGTIEADLTVNAGTVFPASNNPIVVGDPLVFDGDYRQTATGTLRLSPPGADDAFPFVVQPVFTENAELAGTLRLDLNKWARDSAQVGDTVTLATSLADPSNTWPHNATGILGVFDRVIGGSTPAAQSYLDQGQIAILYTANALTMRFSLPGDANLNNQIEQGDLDAVLNNWGRSNLTDANADISWVTGDFNGDGRVAQGDLDLVLNNWGSSATPNLRGLPIPEPASLALFPIAALTLRRRRPA